MNAAKPLELKLIEGNPGKRKIDDIPRPDVTLEEPPEYFDDIARAEWWRIGNELLKLNVITKCDRTALEGYCYYYSQWRKAQQLTDELKTENGGVNQFVWMEHKCFDKMCKLMTEFGLTPSARARIHVKQDGDDGWGDLLD